MPNPRARSFILPTHPPHTTHPILDQADLEWPNRLRRWDNPLANNGWKRSFSRRPQENRRESLIRLEGIHLPKLTGSQPGSLTNHSHQPHLEITGIIGGLCQGAQGWDLLWLAHPGFCSPVPTEGKIRLDDVTVKDNNKNESCTAILYSLLVDGLNPMDSPLDPCILYRTYGNLCQSLEIVICRTSVNLIDQLQLQRSSNYHFS